MQVNAYAQVGTHRDDAGLGDEAAMDLAVDEVRAVRAAGRTAPTR